MVNKHYNNAHDSICLHAQALGQTRICPRSRTRSPSSASHSPLSSTPAYALTYPGDGRRHADDDDNVVDDDDDEDNDNHALHAVSVLLAMIV
jgi:hypothetical protein